MIDFGPIISGYYHSLLIQFGYSTFFGIYFPIGAFIQLVSNIIMILSTCYAYSTYVKRSLSIDTDGIGIWIFMLEVISYAAIIYNGLALVFPCKGLIYMFGDRDYSRDILIILFVEHIVFFFKAYMGKISDSEPEWVTSLKRKEKFLQDREKEEMIYKFKELKNESKVKKE